MNTTCDNCLKEFEYLDCDTWEVDNEDEDGKVSYSVHVYCPHCQEVNRVA